LLLSNFFGLIVFTDILYVSPGSVIGVIQAIRNSTDRAYCVN
jgi:hypothetical protein